MTEKKIKIKFKEGTGFRYVTATGVFGGPTPSGDLLCNFFLEYRTMPEGIDVSVDAQTLNPVEKQIYPEGNDLFIRELQVGVFMSAPTAKVVGEWLINRAEELMKMKETIH